MFVIVTINPSGDVAVFGPYKSKEEAQPYIPYFKDSWEVVKVVKFYGAPNIRIKGKFLPPNDHLNV